MFDIELFLQIYSNIQLIKQYIISLLMLMFVNEKLYMQINVCYDYLQLVFDQIQYINFKSMIN